LPNFDLAEEKSDILEKPQSAKAHYELCEVLAREARYPDALLEVNKTET